MTAAGSTHRYREDTGPFAPWRGAIGANGHQSILGFPNVPERRWLNYFAQAVASEDRSRYGLRAHDGNARRDSGGGTVFRPLPGYQSTLRDKIKSLRGALLAQALWSAPPKCCKISTRNSTNLKQLLLPLLAIVRSPAGHVPRRALKPLSKLSGRGDWQRRYFGTSRIKTARSRSAARARV